MAEGTAGKLSAQLAALGVEARDALQNLSAVAQTCVQEVEEGRKSHQELLVQHRVLQEELSNLKAVHNVQSAAQVSEPYVIVLVDAHSHKFKDDLLKASTNGGSKAAKLLKDVVQQYVTKVSPGAGACRIIVRIYANLKGLDIDDKGSRTFAGFAAGFSREDSFFDFVDVGDRNIVRSKIVDVFEVSVKDPQCRHVLLGACPYTKYMTVLRAPSVLHDKVSCIQGSARDHVMLKARPRTVVFLRVFRTDDQKDSTVRIANGIPAKIFETGACWDFQKDGCFRKDCKYKHIIAWATSTNTATSSTGGDATEHTHSHPSYLPKTSVEGLVPVNANDQRLDLYVSPPSNAQWAAYTARTKTKKLCNAFHLRGACAHTSCEYDHKPIDTDIRKCREDYVRWNDAI